MRAFVGWMHGKAHLKGVKTPGLTLTPRYLLHRVLEPPLGPYIVGTWRVTVRGLYNRNQTCAFKFRGLLLTWRGQPVPRW